ncbi:MAG: Peptidoglycan O-acetyltransferase [Verrucomicrobiota bacterium]|jgi:alginate O-acetyltransferase complex protein AlgI
MVFTSYIFIFYFLPLVLAGYYAMPARSGWRNAWLLLASLIFYGWAEPKFLLLMLAVTAVTYFAGAAIARAPAESTRRQTLLTGAVVACLGALGFFKYFDFALSNLGALSHLLGGPQWSVWGIVLPVGVSFYTFQALSYCVDVYRGDARPARSLTDYACYVALFPQLVAGPIVRYSQVAEQLVERRENTAQFASGVALFMLGFAKKVLLANPLGTVADSAFGAQSLDAAGAWLGVTAYALQIYFDFCGYSDMAVGLGRMFGFEFMKNFDAPYRAESITDFWRRWHISLSTFLRDYLYIPLGGNRGTAARTYANLGIVMLLGGLWHGANWTFIAWGAWHGALLIAERWAGRKSAYQRLPKPARIVTTFILVLGSWVWFRAATLSDALAYFRAMLGGGESSEVTALLAGQLFAPGKLAVMAFAVGFLFARQQAHEWSATLTWRKVAIAFPLFLLSLLALFSQASNPFLYFQF